MNNLGLGQDTTQLAERLRRLSDLMGNPEYKDVPSFVKNEVRSLAEIAEDNRRHVEDVLILMGINET